MGFLDNIRMASLFPSPSGAGSTGTTPNMLFGTPQVEGPDKTDLITQFAQRILPLIHGEQDRARSFGIQDRNVALSQSMAKAANDLATAKNSRSTFDQIQNPTAPVQDPNRSMGPPIRDTNITPYQQEQLLLNRDKLNLTGYQKENELKFKENKNEQDQKLKQQLAGLHNLSDSEKLKLLQEGKISLQNLKDASDMKEIEARGKVSGENATDLEKQRQTGRVDLADINNRARIDLKTTAAPEKPLLPGQQNAQYNGRFNEVANTHPEWSKFVVQDPATKTWSIKQPGSKDGPDDLTYHQIGDFIYGGAAKTEDISLDKPDPLGIRKPGINKPLSSGKK